MKNTNNLLLSLVLTISLFSFSSIHAQWTQKGSDIDGEADNDWFGYSSAISSDGETIAIGGPSNDGNGLNSGHVRVFQYNGSTWVQQGANINGEAAGDQCAFSISMSSDGAIVAIGSHVNSATGTLSGHVRVFKFNGSSWIKQGADIDGGAAGDRSGISVDLSDDGLIVAIGAYGNDGGGVGSFTGRVRVYKLIGSSWVKQGSDLFGEAANDSFGRKVSLSADGLTLAVGATGVIASPAAAGRVKVFTFNGSSWVQKGSNIDGEAASDYARNVELNADGSMIAIGAENNDGNGSSSGHVRVYQYNGTSWVQLGADIDGEAAGDRAGYASLSDDGLTVAVGSAFNDGNGTSSGHVRIFDYTGGAWSQRLGDIDGEAANDRSAENGSVALSSDGNTVVIGAFANTNSNGLSGHARVYTYNPLPIELTRFSVSWNNKSQSEARIEWQTETEVNNEFFYIERSTDAIHFEDIIRVDGAGTSTTVLDYSNIDNALPDREDHQGTFFYRLRQQDFDGSVTYSHIESLNLEEGIDIIILYPNPNFGNFDYIISSSVDSKVRVVILDHTGRLVREETSKITKGINRMEMNIEELSGGNYIFLVETESGLYQASTRVILQTK